MKKVLLLTFALLALSVRANAQGEAGRPIVVQGDPNACELNAATFDNLANILQATSERLFVVARLGKGENSREFNRRRLHNVRTYFKGSWPGVEAKRFVFAEGDRVEAEGRVEFYVGSDLVQISLVKRGRDICVDCCDYPDPRYYGMGKKDKPRRRSR